MPRTLRFSPGWRTGSSWEAGAPSAAWCTGRPADTAWDGAETEWLELPLRGSIHSFTTCYYGGEEFLKDTPYTLILVEFDGVDTLFMSRLVGAEPSEARIGMEVAAQFRRNSKFKVTDVYFVPLE